MTPTFIALTFLATALSVVAVYLMYQDIRKEDTRRIRRRSEQEAARVAQRPEEELFEAFHDEAAWMLDELKPKTWTQKLQAAIEQAALDTTPRRIAIRGCLYGILLAAAFWLLSGQWWIAPLAFAVGLVIPFMAVGVKRRARLDKLTSQLPDVFAMMSRVMRSGQTTDTAIELVSREFDDPVAGEFAFCAEEQRLGIPLETALRDLAKRTGLLEVKMFVIASTVQREAGGNLAELLDNLASVIRARFRIRRIIKTLTAEGRLQAAILLLLPFILFVLLMMMEPTYFSVLLDFPWLIGLALILETIGAVWIRNIINIDY